MLPDWVSNPGPLTYESGAIPIALRGPASSKEPTAYLSSGLGFEPHQRPLYSMVTQLRNMLQKTYLPIENSHLPKKYCGSKSSWFTIISIE